MPTYISLDNLQQYHTSLTNGIGQGFQDLQDQIDALSSGTGADVASDDTAFIMCIHFLDDNQLLVGGYQYGSNSANIEDYFSEEIQEPADASDLLEQDLLTFLNTNKPPHLRIFIYHRTKQPETTFPVTSLFASYVGSGWVAPSSVNDNSAFSLSDNTTDSFIQGFNTEYLYQVIGIPPFVLQGFNTEWSDIPQRIEYDVPVYFIIPPDGDDPAELIGVIEHPKQGINQLVMDMETVFDVIVNPINNTLNIRVASAETSSDSATSSDSEPSADTPPSIYIIDNLCHFGNDENTESVVSAYSWPILSQINDGRLPFGPINPNVKLYISNQTMPQFGYAHKRNTDQSWIDILLLDDQFNPLGAYMDIDQNNNFVLTTSHLYLESDYSGGAGTSNYNFAAGTTVIDGLCCFDALEE